MRRTTILTLLALASTPAAAAPAPGDPLSGYVLWGPNAQPIARIVLNGVNQPCPSLAGGTAMTARTNPNPATFPITVCEALVPPGQTTSITVNGRTVSLPAANPNPADIAIYGDSGCKAPGQDCGAATWPWPALVQAGAARNPDLVIHVGDYNYRGTPNKVSVNGQTVWVYDGCGTTGVTSQNAPGSSLPDNWADWQADFFAPAAPLLAEAAWVVMRGNHELCSRAGPGWFYLLDPRSNLLGPGHAEMSCPVPATAPDISPTYTIPLKPVTLVMFDSANACDYQSFAPLDPAVTAAYAPLLQAVQAQFAGGSGWFMTHRPLLGVWSTVAGPTGQTVTTYGNQTMLPALGTPPVLPAGAALTVSGHMHLFQSSTPASGLPPQLVVGNGGVQLQPAGTPATYQSSLNGVAFSGTTLSSFGWLWIDRITGPANWSGTLLGADGSTQGSCGQPVANGSVCALAN